jgi:hypothetical protein
MSQVIEFPIRSVILYMDDDVVLVRNTIGREVTYNLELINELPDLDSNA